MDRQILSQEEINALLQDMDSDVPAAPLLSADHKDALGEIGNICYGAAATALSQMLNKRVDINTPNVFITTLQDMKEQHPAPYVLVEVDYKEGLVGTNALILKIIDASVIASLFLGNDGTNPKPELDELELSAVSEAMNQMVGNAATSMSTMFNRKVDMQPPRVKIVDLAKDPEALVKNLANDDYVAVVKFKLEIDGLVNSEIMLVLPFEFAVELVDALLGQAQQPSPPRTAAPPPAPVQERREPERPSYQPEANYNYSTPPVAAAPPNHAPVYYNTAQQPPQPQVMVQPAHFAALGNNKAPKDVGNIGMILDVPLQLTVELGSTRMKIKEILELGLGSVIELDKLAGDPVDIFVNGKLIAKGEVVVIDENFGIKVTDIVSHLERVNTLQ